MVEGQKNLNNFESLSEKQQLLDAVAQRIKTEMVCPLKDAAKNLVFGKGNPDAFIMVIGEASGAREDELGIPFVGKAGQQLDRCLKKINLSLDDVYIANILKYRPPKNRNPTAEEMKRHTPYLIEQIKIIQPKILVTLGNFATRFVLNGFNAVGINKIEGITKLHGQAQKITINSHEYLVFPQYHPAATLYNPNLWTTLEDDFVKMKPYLR